MHDTLYFDVSVGECFVKMSVASCAKRRDGSLKWTVGYVSTSPALELFELPINFAAVFDEDDDEVVASRAFKLAPIRDDGIAAMDEDDAVDWVDTFRCVTSRSMEKWVSCTVAACVAAATAAAAAEWFKPI